MVNERVVVLRDSVLGDNCYRDPRSCRFLDFPCVGRRRGGRPSFPSRRSMEPRRRQSPPMLDGRQKPPATTSTPTRTVARSKTRGRCTLRCSSHRGVAHSPSALGARLVPGDSLCTRTQDRSSSSAPLTGRRTQRSSRCATCADFRAPHAATRLHLRLPWPRAARGSRAAAGATFSRSTPQSSSARRIAPELALLGAQRHDAHRRLLVAHAHPAQR